MSDIITIVAPVNIAVIKYWGKRDEDLILPLNDSVSVTLDTSIMCAKTSVCARPEFVKNRIWLNGKEESFDNERLQNCLKAIQAKAANETSVSKEFLSWKIHVCSENNFPTAAGLASSAAGYACLVSALAKLYKINSDVSSIARLGSGSACRSIYGGFVRWYAGIKPDGSDSVASQIVGSDHWPEMRALILVTGTNKKIISSTNGMKITTETSELLEYRVKHCVPKRTKNILISIYQKDFARFAEITMKESNQFHAICLDSYPPFVYMTDVSYFIMHLIHKYNEICGEVKVAYTFDAGPNACLYLLKDDVPKVLSLIKYAFPSSNVEFITGLQSNIQELDTDMKKICEPHEQDLIKYVIHTKIGDGPFEISDGLHLLNDSGLPNNSM